MTPETLIAQTVTSMPVWAQWLLALVVTLYGPTLAALARSEILAMDGNTMANGILHKRALVNKLLQVPDAPPVPQTLQEQITALQAEVKVLQAARAKEIVK